MTTTDVKQKQACREALGQIVRILENVTNVDDIANARLVAHNALQDMDEAEYEAQQRPDLGAVREALLRVKHESPSHPRGVGFNEGVDAALAILPTPQAQEAGE